MSPISSILLNGLAPSQPSKITQLYQYLELFSEGDPATHTLFVMGHGPAGDDQLLLIDPPAEVTTRFRLEGQVAAAFTAEPLPVDVPLVQTLPGGVAHLRIGEHFVDLYTQTQGAAVYLPALGVLCSGRFGSDVTVPTLASDSNGDEELETLRLLARLMKQRRLQVLIPRVGNLATETPSAMRRLAEDVAYLHGLQRVASPLAQRGGELAELMRVAETLLPAERRTERGWADHRVNLSRLHEHYVARRSAE